MLNDLLAHPRRILAAIAALAVAMLLFAVVYLQHIVGLEPCPMCIVQRELLIGVALFCALAAAVRRPGWRFLLAAVALVAAVLGAVTAARQSWMQWYPEPFATCGRDLYGIIESFPLSRAIPMVFRGSGECSTVDWTLLGGTIANWSFLWFLSAGIVLLVLLLHRTSRHA